MRKYRIALYISALALAACGGDDGSNQRRTNPNSAAAGSGANPAGGGLIPTDNGSSGPIKPSSNVPNPGVDPNVCASAMVTATRVTPTVYFVIDGSGSMNAPFGGGSRWSVLREALIGDMGVMRQLNDVVRFGMAIYSNNDAMKCPAMSDVQASLSNLSKIEPAYPQRETGGGTPTGEALQKVVDQLPDFNNMLDSKETPPIIILATDGEPNGCNAVGVCNWAADVAGCLGNLAGQLTMLANAPATYDTTLAAVRAAKAKRVPVWVVSLADGLANIPDLQKTANIGAGLADNASPGATIYSPKNPADLTNTLKKLLGDAASCDVELAGRLAVSRACEGTVMMNGQKLECGSEQGWKALDEKHISLRGDACTRFKSDPTILLDARFPCDVVLQ